MMSSRASQFELCVCVAQQFILIIQQLLPCTGAARLTQIFLPLIRRSNGRIVFLSSGESHQPIYTIKCDWICNFIRYRYISSMKLWLVSRLQFVVLNALLKPASKVWLFVFVKSCVRVTLMSQWLRLVSLLPAPHGSPINLWWNRWYIHNAIRS